jgi:hypothetical protein
MLLRKITNHVTDQNWFAVFIDFIIVVVGVFIGIQVANWNETQNNKKGLVSSLERLSIEVTQNIKITDTILVLFEKSQNDMDIAREALNTCNYSVDNQAALEKFLIHLTADIHPNFITVVRDQFARQDHYLDLLPAKIQAEFGDYSARVSIEHDQLANHYDKIWAQHINYHPAVNAYFSNSPSDTTSYQGWGFKLDKPFEEICKDASFRNQFINVIGFYVAINRRLIRFKAEIQNFQSTLLQELEAK